MTRSPPMPRALCLLVAWLVALAAGCVYPATELRVLVSTDVDPTVPFALTVRAYAGRTSGAMVMAHTFRRALPGEPGGADAGISLPASLTVVPGTTPRDGVVRIEVEGDADGTRLRRVAVVSFVPRARLLVRVFLAARCADPALGCATAPCTVQSQCEERGQTCGDQGTCVPVETAGTRDLDAGFGEAGAPTATCGRPGLGCCAIGEPCAAGGQCVDQRCSACPAGSEACCDGNGVAVTDGTVCAPTSETCRAPGTCTAGVCGAPTDVADGTECGPPAGPCALPSQCSAGVCAPRPGPDGVVCAMMAGGCFRDGVCMGGACSGVTPLPDGTVCAMTNNPCQRDGTCRAGMCTGTTAAPDGTQCAAGNTATCTAARVCRGGACQPAGALADGTVCRAARNACELAARCAGGRCPANPRRADNYVISATQRCCGGAPTSVTTATNCNVCGLRCASGRCVARTLSGVGTEYFCACSSNAQCAPLTTCRNQTPNANVCSCNSSAECPGTATCVDVSFNPNYCN